MKAVTWHGRRDVRVDDVPDPRIELTTDMVIRLTTTAICGFCSTGCSLKIHLNESGEAINLTVATDGASKVMVGGKELRAQ